LVTTHAKVANSGSGKMVIARCRMRYFLQQIAALRPSLLESQIATVARYFSGSLLLSTGYHILDLF